MYKYKSKRSWHAGKPKKKQGYNLETVTAELLEAVVNVYGRLDERGKHPSLHAIVDELDCGLNPLKVRKLLITAGEVKREQVYKSATADEVLRFWKDGMTVEEIMSILELSRASVNSYLPYTKIIYKMKESSIGADRMKSYRERKKACERLRAEPGVENLWNAVIAFQGYPFKTSKGLKFSYMVKGGEMLVDRKEKSITRATVELAYRRTLEMGGIVEGPKKLGVFGASYLYPVFVRLGVIRL